MRLRIIFLCLALALVASCRAKSPQYPAEEPPVSQAKQNKGENLFLEAEAYFQQRDYRLARQTYAAYLKQHPDGPRANQARLREAELLGLLGDWPGSLSYYQEIIKQGVEGEAAYQARYGIGRANFKLGRFQAAAGVLESLTASQLPEPLRFATNALLTEIALKNGEVEPAFLRLRLASRDLGAGDQEWFEHLKTRLVEQASPAELASLANLYRDSALTAPLLLRLARLAQEEGRADEARQWLQTLKERFPDAKEAQVQTKESPKAPPRPVLGCLLPLSGANAEYGHRVKQGMELAAQGTNLELIFRDTAKDPAQTARLVQELAQDSRVTALIGPLTSAEAQAAAEAAQTAGIPLISLSQKRDLTVSGPLIYRVFLTPAVQVRALLRHTVGEKGLKRYAMLSPDSAYGRTMAQVFGDELLVQGGVLVSQASYPPDTRDFAQALSSLFPDSPPGAEASPAIEALFIPDEAGIVAAIATQAAQRPSGKVQLLGTNLAKPKKEQAGLSQALNGIMFPDAFFAGDPNPAVQNFIAAYRQRYGALPDHLAAQGYLVVRLMAQVLEGPNPPSREDLPNRLSTIGEVPDLPWFKGFAADRQADLSLYLLTIRNGQVELVSVSAAGQP
ncbi:MAG: penicillin-binding protein activator [Desulfobaccales bacterium]